MVGSLLMLAAIIAFGISQGTFDLVQSGTSDNVWIFLGFAVAFAIKSPLFPFHGWLQITYREAPVEVAGLLSGIVAKAAVFGFIRIALPKFPDPVATMRDDDPRACSDRPRVRLAARVPLAHDPRRRRVLVDGPDEPDHARHLLGERRGISGAVLHSVSHGLVSVAMFVLAGIVIERVRDRPLRRARRDGERPPDPRDRPDDDRDHHARRARLGELRRRVPVLLGVFGQGWGYAALGAAAIVLAAMYTLRLISAVLHERRGAKVPSDAADLQTTE